MAEENEQYYDDFLKSESNLRANTPLPNNPNQVLKNILSPADIEKLAIIRNDELYKYFDKNYDHNLEEEYDERIAPLIRSYNLSPIDYEARLPDRYHETKAALDKETADKDARRKAILDTGTQAELADFDLMEANRSVSQAELDYGMAVPYNLERRIAIAKLGYDPDLSIDKFLDPNQDIPGNPFTGKFALQYDLALNTRNMTKKQWEHLAKRHGLDGELRYMDPANSEEGVVYRPKGSDTWHQMDTPEMEWEDIATGLGREVPAIVGDLLFSLKGAGRLEPILKKIPDVNIDFTSGPVQRFLQTAGVAVFAGAGTALGEYIRMTAGRATGANDLSYLEIFKESGMMALLAMGGTAFIGVGLQVLPALTTAMTKGRIPPEVLRQIREDLTAAQASRVRGVIPERDAGAFGEALSEKEVMEAVEEMVGATKAKGWKPTIGQTTGKQRMIDLENAFIRSSDNAAVSGKFYSEIVQGNDRVILAYAKALANSSREDLIKKYKGMQPTGTQLSVKILQQIEKETAQIYDDAIQMMFDFGQKLRGDLPISNIGVDIAGSRLFQKVYAADISKGGNVRYRTRLQQSIHDYMEPYNKAVDDGINNPQWRDTRIGSGKTREPAEAWAKARNKATDDIFVNPEADEAVDIFWKMLGTNGSETLHRLIGRETVKKTIKRLNKRTGKTETVTVNVPAKFKGGNFSFRELEQARVSLNDLASGLIGKNALAVKYARALERGVEAQQYQLIKKAAKEELERLGKKSTPKAVDNYVYHPIDNPNGTFGAEIYETWLKRNEAFEKAHADSIGALIKADRNGVVEYLLQGNKPGSKSNQNVAEIMHLIRSQSGKGGALEGAIPEIQSGLVERVRFIIDDVNLSPLKRAQAYNKFMRQNEGTFREVFGEGYKPRFGTPEQFRKTVMRPLQKYEQSIADIQKEFGTKALPDPSTTNIISGILFSSTKDIQAGITLAKVEKLLPYIEKDPVLMAQIASEIQDVISYRIVRRIKGRTISGPDADAISNIFEGYSIKGAGNPNNTFENVIGPLLGKGSKKYIHNLRVMDEMLQRELAQPSPGSVAAIKRWTDPGVAWWKRMFIKPLTQLGRRVTATERLAGSKAAKSLGLILQNEKLLDMTIKAMEGKATRRAYEKALIAWLIGTGRGDDLEFLPFSDYWASEEIGSDFKNYDRDKKERRIEKRTNPSLDTLKSLIDNNFMYEGYKL